MKVLVLSSCYPRRSSLGTGVFIHEQTRALAALGVDCHVIQPVPWAPPGPLHRLRDAWSKARAEYSDMLPSLDGVRIHHPRVYSPIPSRLFPGDYWTRTGNAVARYVGRRRELRDADLLYAHFLSNDGYAGLIASRQLGLPLVAIARGDDVHAWPQRWPDRRRKVAAVLAGADGVLACSRALAHDAMQWSDGTAPARPIEVVYNGVDCTRFSPVAGPEAQLAIRRRFRLPEHRRFLLCVACPVPEKGWLDLLDALCAAGPAAAEWDLVGVTAPYTPALELRAEASKRGLAGRLHLMGPLAPNEMPDIYRAVDAFALASHNEGLSNSVLEAMASALPVVTTLVGGHAEALRNGESGMLVPPRDVQKLAAALAELFSDASAAAAMGARARRAALEWGDYTVNAGRLVHYFERVLLKPPCAA